MDWSRRRFLATGGVLCSAGVGGCVGFGGSGGLPVTVRNSDSRHHVVAVLVTDTAGNTNLFDGTIRVETDDERTFENRIAVPDSLPYDAVVRVLLDTGTATNIGDTLQADTSVTITIESEDTIQLV